MQSQKHLPLVTLVLAFLAYFPFLFATQFLYPLGIHEWDFTSQYYGELPVMEWWDSVLYWYQRSTGRYTSTALLTSLPFWYDLSFFRLWAFLDLLLIPIIAGWFLQQLFPRRSAIFLLAILLLLYLHQLSNLFDSLLRFTCMPIYHAGLMGTLLFMGLLIKQLKRKAVSYLLLPAILLTGGLTIGTNEISLVQVMGISVVLLASFYWSSQSPPKYLWVIFFVLLGFCGIALLAPGNFVRIENYESGGALFPAIYNSMGVSIYLWVSWIADSMLLPAGLLWFMILMSKTVSLRPEINFGRPLFWLMGLMVLTPASLFPLLLGTGSNSLAERVVDLIFFFQAILWFGMVTALYQSYEWKIPEWKISRWAILPLYIFVILHTFADGLNVNRQTPKDRAKFLDLIAVDANIGRAWLQVIDGTAMEYAREMENIDQLVKQCTSDTCWVPTLQSVDFIGYDPLYDRLWEGGDNKMGKALGNEQVKLVLYE